MAFAMPGCDSAPGMVESPAPRHDRRMARALRVEVTFLGALQQIAGRGTMWLELPQFSTIARAFALLRERQPQFQGVEMTCLVNGMPSKPDQQLSAGDGLFLMLPEV